MIAKIFNKTIIVILFDVIMKKDLMIKFPMLIMKVNEKHKYQLENQLHQQYKKNLNI